MHMTTKQWLVIAHHKNSEVVLSRDTESEARSVYDRFKQTRHRNGYRLISVELHEPIPGVGWKTVDRCKLD